MIEKGQTITGEITAYGAKGDSIIHLEHIDKVLIVKKISEDINQHTFIGDKIKAEVTEIHENFCFVKMIEVIDKKTEYKYRIMLDLADLLYMDENKFSFSALKRGTKVPTNLKKKGAKQVFVTMQTLMRENNKLQHKLNKLQNSEKQRGDNNGN